MKIRIKTEDISLGISTGNRYKVDVKKQPARSAE
jgi:hypothetical protein